MEATTKKTLLYAGLGLGVLLLINRAGQVNDTINGLTFSSSTEQNPRDSLEMLRLCKRSMSRTVF